MSYQDKAIGTLNEFHRVCEKNGIKYQLAFGSLLGAVRDNGQIPWDYDIDVIVPYNEKDSLIVALKRDLNSDYYFYCPEQDKKCRHFIMRLAPKGYKTNLLHVDVFYTISAPESRFERNQFEKEMQKLFHQRYYKLVKYEDLPRVRSKIKAFLYKMLLLPLSVNKITTNMKEICERYDSFKTKCCIVMQGGYRNKSFDTEKLWNTKLCETEIGVFRITKNYEYVLKIIYGDYKRIFPLEDRLNEMLTHYNVLSENNVSLVNSGSRGRYYMKKEDLS